MFHRPPSPEADVAEQTRQQLAKMGINMDDFHAEKSYRYSSVCFHPAQTIDRIYHCRVKLIVFEPTEGGLLRNKHVRSDMLFLFVFLGWIKRFSLTLLCCPRSTMSP